MYMTSYPSSFGDMYGGDSDSDTDNSLNEFEVKSTPTKDEDETKDKPTIEIKEDDDKPKDEDGTEDNADAVKADTKEDAKEDGDDAKEDGDEEDGSESGDDTEKTALVSEPPTSTTSVTFDALYDILMKDDLVESLKNKSDIIKENMKVLVVGASPEYIKYQPNRDHNGFVLSNDKKQEINTLYKTETCRAFLQHVNVPSINKNITLSASKYKEIFKTCVATDTPGILQKLKSDGLLPSDGEDSVEITMNFLLPNTPYVELLFEEHSDGSGNILNLTGDNMDTTFNFFKCKALSVDDTTPKKIYLSSVLNLLAECGVKHISVINLASNVEDKTNIQVISPSKGDDSSEEEDETKDEEDKDEDEDEDETKDEEEDKDETKDEDKDKDETKDEDKDKDETKEEEDKDETKDEESDDGSVDDLTAESKSTTGKSTESEVEQKEGNENDSDDEQPPKIKIDNTEMKTEGIEDLTEKKGAIGGKKTRKHLKLKAMFKKTRSHEKKKV